MTVDELIEELQELKKVYVMAGRATIYPESASASTIKKVEFEQEFNFLNLIFE